MRDIFLRILTLSLTCSLLLLPLLAFARGFHSRYAAKTLYFVWLLLAVRLVVPIGADHAPVKVSLPDYIVRSVSTPQPAAIASTTEAPTLEFGDSPQVVTQVMEDVVISDVEASYTRTVGLSSALAILWAEGAGAFLFFQVAAYLLARRRILSVSTPASEAEWVLLEQLRAELGVRSRSGLCRSGRVSSPVMLGLFDSIIVLPDWEADRDTVEAVLRHELCHLKRADVAYKALLLLCNAVHWFNPLVWLMAREAARNVELCCDDEVLRNADTPTRKHYGEVLLDTAAGGIYPAFSTHFGSGKKQLKERLLNLFQVKRNSAALVAMVLVLALVGGSLVACESSGKTADVALHTDASSETPMPTVAPALSAPTEGVCYAKFQDFARQGDETDFESANFQLVEYDSASGLLGSDAGNVTLTMADDLRVTHTGGSSLQAGAKGTQERQKALLNFFYWPIYRDKLYMGRTDFIKLELRHGEVVGMTWMMTPFTAESAVDAQVQSITYRNGEFVFCVPADYTPATDWNIHISGRIPGPGGFMSAHYLENTKWESGKYYSFTDDFIGAAAQPVEGASLTMEISCAGQERSVDLLALAADTTAPLDAFRTAHPDFDVVSTVRVDADRCVILARERPDEMVGYYAPTAFLMEQKDGWRERGKVGCEPALTPGFSASVYQSGDLTIVVGDLGDKIMKEFNPDFTFVPFETVDVTLDTSSGTYQDSFQAGEAIFFVLDGKVAVDDLHLSVDGVEVNSYQSVYGSAPETVVELGTATMAN